MRTHPDSKAIVSVLRGGLQDLGDARSTARRSATLRAEPRKRVSVLRMAAAIARALPHRFVIYACAAICIVADIALWRLA